MGINRSQILMLDRIKVFHNLYHTNLVTSKLFLEISIFQKCSLKSKISINMGINRTQIVMQNEITRFIDCLISKICQPNNLAFPITLIYEIYGYEYQ